MPSSSCGEPRTPRVRASTGPMRAWTSAIWSGPLWRKACFSRCWETGGRKPDGTPATPVLAEISGRPAGIRPEATRVAGSDNGSPDPAKVTGFIGRPGETRRFHNRMMGEGLSRVPGSDTCRRNLQIAPVTMVFSLRGAAVQGSGSYRYRWAILFAAFVAGMAGPIALFAMPPLFPSLTAFLGVSLSGIGFAAMTSFGIGISVMAIPFAILSPRLGWKTAGIACLGTISMGALIATVFPTFWGIFLGRFIAGLGFGMACHPKA